MAKPAQEIETTMDNIPFFYKWQKGEGIDVVETFFIKDLKEVPLKWWDRMGGDGTLFNMEGAGDATGAYIVEIAPGKSLNPMRHLYEELILVVQGRGATTIWNDNGAKQTFEWQEGSLISVPLNVHHQHFNGQGDKPARLFSVNNMPIVFSLFHNEEFIFNTPYDFVDRFDGRPDFFSSQGTQHPGRIWETNFIADTRTFNLQEWKERGAGGKNVFLEMCDGTMAAHISEFPVGTYKKAHRHGPGFNVIIIKGQGFSLFWWEGEEPKRYDWQDGSVFVPPEKRQIGMVFQDPFLFSGSIEENIRMGARDPETVKDKDIVAAATAANAHGFITQLTDGYATEIGERGIKLSGGERQRIAIARVLLRDPKLLLLDEATSALDSETEKVVTEALERLMKGRTSFVIAHRLCTVLNADVILAIENGRVVETGTHPELLARGGLYARSYHLQFSETPNET